MASSSISSISIAKSPGNEPQSAAADAATVISRLKEAPAKSEQSNHRGGRCPSTQASSLSQPYHWHQLFPLVPRAGLGLFPWEGKPS